MNMILRLIGKLFRFVLKLILVIIIISAAIMLIPIDGERADAYDEAFESAKQAAESLKQEAENKLQSVTENLPVTLPQQSGSTPAATEAEEPAKDDAIDIIGTWYPNGDTASDDILEIMEEGVWAMKSGGVPMDSGILEETEANTYTSVGFSSDGEFTFVVLSETEMTVNDAAYMK